MCEKIPRQTLDNVFMTLRGVAIEAIKRGGNKIHKPGHWGKGTEKETSALPCLFCPQEVTETGQHVIGGPCMHVPVPMSPLLRRCDEEDGHEQSLMSV